MRELPDWNRPSRADATGHVLGHEISRVPVSRRGYLDWLRGVAVLIMVAAHLFDAWVRVIDRSEHPYQWAMVVGGFSAPLFLFLAGVAMALAAGSRLRKGLTAAETAAIARRRGWQILGLAFLFRLQSFIISGGPFPETLLKVDILNVMGLSMGGIFLVYTGTSIARVFFITAATYGAMSLYGYTTRSDLSGFGSFLMMGLIGIVIASLVNIFVGSSALQFAISVIGVLVFVGLTAYDTQRIKEMYLESDSAEIADKKAVMGALALYLDFINLFLFLLRLFGRRR